MSKRKNADITTDSAKKPRSIASFFVPQASVPASATATKFDKSTWVAKLDPETRTLLQLEIDTLHDSWLGALQDELKSPEFLSLKRFLKKEKDAGATIYPPEPDIYSWSRHTPLDTVKVIVLGQDPYHSPRQAMGLSFSVRPPTPAPPSLQNMYRALRNDYPEFIPPPNRGGLLTPWADRGVLMLNACLTVRAGSANSHSKKGWERLTQRVIDVVNQRRRSGVVFMAWGTPAGQRVTKVDKQRHLVLTSVHPSPLSAHKGFFECGHFRRANEWLETRYGPEGPIDWSLHEAPTPSKLAVLAKEDIFQDEKAQEELDEEQEGAMIQAVIEAEEAIARQVEGQRDTQTRTVNCCVLNTVGKLDMANKIEPPVKRSTGNGESIEQNISAVEGKAVDKSL